MKLLTTKNLINFYKPNDLSYIYISRYWYDYIFFQNFSEKFYISEIHYNNVTKTPITSKIIKLPYKLHYDVEQLTKSIEVKTKALLSFYAQS